MRLFRWKSLNHKNPVTRNNQNKSMVREEKNVLAGDERVRLISDEPLVQQEGGMSSLNFGEYSKALANIIETSPPKFSIGIFGGWGTGKTRLMKLIFTKLRSSEKITPIWFNAWKYERDKYLAVIPLLKLIDIELQNRRDWKSRILKKGVESTFRAFAESISITAGLDNYASIGIDLNKFLNLS